MNVFFLKQRNSQLWSPVCRRRNEMHLDALASKPRDVRNVRLLICVGPRGRVVVGGEVVAWWWC